MAVVVEKKINNTVVRIHDDYCRSTTPEQVQEILKRIALRAKAEFNAGNHWILPVLNWYISPPL